MTCLTVQQVRRSGSAESGHFADPAGEFRHRPGAATCRSTTTLTCIGDSSLIVRQQDLWWLVNVGTQLSATISDDGRRVAGLARSGRPGAAGVRAPPPCCSPPGQPPMRFEHPLRRPDLHPHQDVSQPRHRRDHHRAGHSHAQPETADRRAGRTVAAPGRHQRQRDPVVQGGRRPAGLGAHPVQPEAGQRLRQVRPARRARAARRSRAAGVNRRAGWSSTRWPPGWSPPPTWPCWTTMGKPDERAGDTTSASARDRRPG